jgi:hypothetical protein
LTATPFSDSFETRMEAFFCSPHVRTLQKKNGKTRFVF